MNICSICFIFVVGIDTETGTDIVLCSIICCFVYMQQITIRVLFLQSPSKSNFHARIIFFSTKMNTEAIIYIGRQILLLIISKFKQIINFYFSSNHQK